MSFKKKTFLVALLVVLVSQGCSNRKASPVPSYDSIGQFSGGLAPVKSQGKWGFIDTGGNMIIPAVYDAVTSFSENLAGFESLGKWGCMDKIGTPVIEPRFFSIQHFSEGLAPVQRRASSLWEYVDRTGQTAISAQYDAALPFSQGFAPVLRDGKWRYIRADGSEAFTTEFYRVYPFGSEGLALVRPEMNGKYGYIAMDGTLKIPAVFNEGRPFSGGIAAVRVSDKWGYIDTSGKTIIEPAYDYASSCSEGAMPFVENGRFGFLNCTGGRLIEPSFESALPFLNGRALVRVNGTWTYIDTSGKILQIARALPKNPIPANDVSGCEVDGGVVNAYQGGFARFRLVNVDSPFWYINLDTQLADKFTALPSFPGGLDYSGNSHYGDYQSFIFHFPTASHIIGNPFFNLVMTGDGGTVTLSVSSKYKDPPKQTGHPAWDYLKGSVKIIKGLAMAVSGREFMALFNLSVGTADIIAGDVDQSAINNALPDGTGTFLLTSITGKTKDGHSFAPFDGSFCGGDEYTISDANSLVVDMSAARTDSMPGEVDVTFYRFDRFYALKSAKRFDDWRITDIPSTPGSVSPYLSPPYDTILKKTFANYMDTDDSDLCQNKDGTDGYMVALSKFTVNQLVDFWFLANNFGLVCNNEKEGGVTWCQYFENLLTYSCSP